MVGGEINLKGYLNEFFSELKCKIQTKLVSVYCKFKLIENSMFS